MTNARLLTLSKLHTGASHHRWADMRGRAGTFEGAQIVSPSFQCARSYNLLDAYILSVPVDADICRSNKRREQSVGRRSLLFLRVSLAYLWLQPANNEVNAAL